MFNTAFEFKKEGFYNRLISGLLYSFTTICKKKELLEQACVGTIIFRVSEEILLRTPPFLSSLRHP